MPNCCLSADIVNGNIANQIHGFTIDYGKLILIAIIFVQYSLDITTIKRANLVVTSIFSKTINVPETVRAVMIVEQ